jgi:lipopolysaccharide/colanic/teichoic acid biosynthesis glycosyltransferase
MDTTTHTNDSKMMRTAKISKPMRVVSARLDTAAGDSGHYAISPWCRSFGKRAFDLTLASMMTLLVLPLIPLIAIAVKLSSPGCVFFRQRRVGLDGVEFELLKFRTMIQNSQGGPGVTSSGDRRVTRVGQFLRKSKLDELPQLFCVLSGHMSLVGPRPDLPQYFVSLDKKYHEVLRLRPGLTGRASVRFRNEEEILSRVPPDELESFYVSTVFPWKIQLEMEYAETASLWRDVILLFQTFFRLFSMDTENLEQFRQGDPSPGPSTLC